MSQPQAARLHPKRARDSAARAGGEAASREATHAALIDESEVVRLGKATSHPRSAKAAR